jgi:hypothetical protein
MKARPLAHGLSFADVDPSMGEPRFYWGVKCRTCSETVAFGLRRDPEFGGISSFLKPGKFQCPNGHVHIYFCDDRVFFRNEDEIPREVIKRNRAAYRPIPPPESE